jgi:hypothetical protein
LARFRFASHFSQLLLSRLLRRYNSQIWNVVNR